MGFRTLLQLSIEAKARRATRITNNGAESSMHKQENLLNYNLAASIEVRNLRSGEEASLDEPLTLFQARRFYCEELMAWGGRVKGGCLLDELKDALHDRDDSFLDQLIPAQRGVITMAFARPPKDSPKAARLQDFPDTGYPNQFLLVRNGQNVRAVFSLLPTHEAAQALFPSTNEAGLAFDGIDATGMTLDEAWHSDTDVTDEKLFARVLGLLNYLHETDRSFVPFHPRSPGSSLLDLEFQRRHLKFVAEEHAMDASEPTEQTSPVFAWIAECNRSIRKGSRVLVSELQDGGVPITDYPFTDYRRTFNLSYRSAPQLVSSTDGYHHLDIGKKVLTATDIKRVGWLNGPHAAHHHPAKFLCLEKINLDELSHHLRCRKGRSTNLAVLKLLRDAEHVLLNDLENEKSVREHMRNSSFFKYDIPTNNVEEAITEAIADWRALHMGSDPAKARDLGAIERMLLNPERRQSLEDRARDTAKGHAAKIGAFPLLVTATDDNEYALYATATEQDQDRHGAPGGVSFGVHWGWVMRYRISCSSPSSWTISKGKPVWLLDHPMCAERTLQSWPKLQAFLNKSPEPVDRLKLRRFHKDMQAATQWAAVLRNVRMREHHDPVKNGRQDNVRAFLPPEIQGISPEYMKAIIGVYESRMNPFAKGTVQDEGLILCLPIAVVQAALDEPPRYVYAAAKLTHVVRHCATPLQQRAIARAKGAEFDAPAQGESQLVWAIIDSASPIKGPIGEMSVNSGHLPLRLPPPNWASPKSRQLNFNRAFDNLMGKNPHTRRDFYRQCDKWKVFALESETLKNVFRTFDAQYKAVTPASVSLSPLVWDHNQGRGIGNCYFQTGTVMLPLANSPDAQEAFT